jgi:hypothetical protein
MEKVGAFERMMNNLMGIPNPGPEYRMEGYVYEELGPIVFEKKGIEKMETEVDELKAHLGKDGLTTGASGMCPFASMT